MTTIKIKNNLIRAFDTDEQQLTAIFEALCLGLHGVDEGHPEHAGHFSVFTLDGLLDLLVRAYNVAPVVTSGSNLECLPTFGDEIPEVLFGTGCKTRVEAGIYSWDEDRLLVGTCLGDLQIVDR